MDCCNAKRLCSYFLHIRLTNMIAERLRRWLKSVIFIDDVRFVGSKPSLVTFLLTGCICLYYSNLIAEL